MIVIIKYNCGNISSVKNAIQRLGYSCAISDDPETIIKADKVILPGVGEASSAMRYLKDRNLDKVIQLVKNPFLGICLGLQLMCKHSEEGDTGGLNIFDANVKLFPSEGIVPHMGWNNFESLKGDLFNDVEITSDVYYVHSYYAEKCQDTIASCDYLRSFSCALQKNNFYATQFHPEKSAKVGEQILKNFLKL